MNSFTEDEIKIIVLDKLRKRGCWGRRYTPLDSLIRWLGKKIKRNGRRLTLSPLKWGRFSVFLPLRLHHTEFWAVSSQPLLWACSP